MHIISALTSWLVDTIGRMGYTGIVSLMFLESSFFPFPSEVVMPPAGYLAWKGEMSLALVLLSGIAGSILGALFNYWIAVKFGRPFLLRWGKYFFVSPESIDKADKFFQKHGHVSTLVGRLLPVIRQYISLPAGIARMPLKVFTLYTTIGAGAWVVVLTLYSRRTSRTSQRVSSCDKHRLYYLGLRYCRSVYSDSEEAQKWLMR